MSTSGANPPGGAELGAALVYTTLGPYTSLAEQAVTGLSVNVDCDGSPVYVGLSGMYLSAMSADLNTVLRVWDGAVGSGTELARFTSTFRQTAFGMYTPFNMRNRVELSAGAHTLNVGISAGGDTGAAVWLAADAVFPWILSVTQA